jgi:molybdopterin-guanine dinucleotide biosynthesis protein
MMHGHEMMVMVIKHEEMDTELSDQGKDIIVGFTFAGLK